MCLTNGYYYYRIITRLQTVSKTVSSLKEVTIGKILYVCLYTYMII